MNFDYNPNVFLRCHSRTDKDYADIRTQIWQAAFKPGKNKPLVATCGGNKICLINASTSKVEQRYTCRDVRELLQSLAWGYLQTGEKSNSVVVAGGALSIIYIIDPKQHTEILEYKVTSRSSTVISSLLFTSDENVLLCATNRGDIYCYQMDLSNGIREVKVNKLQTLSIKKEIICCCYCCINSMLFVATDDGLYSSVFNSNNVVSKWCELYLKKELTEIVSISTANLVDSVEVIGNNLVAAKWALRNFIYIWGINDVCISSARAEITPRYVLRWRDTDNYYMGISANIDAGILTCGDDKGCIWLYDIRSFNADEPLKKSCYIDPIKILKWPKLNDPYGRKSRKLDLDVYDIVIAKAAVHITGKYIVAVTNNNLVCIWSTVN